MTKILLVEDDKSLREIYGVRLLAEGYDIVSAGDGEEALAMAIKERPELIISDVMMPKISGFDMLDILRSTTETRDIKVIMMTALSSDDQRARGEQLGANRYLVKSQVGIEDVVHTVHEVLADADKIVPSSATPANPSENVDATAPAPAPTMTPAPSDSQPSSSLPQPTAPFSSPHPDNLGERVINPIPSNAPEPTIGSKIEDELAAAAPQEDENPLSTPAPAPTATPEESAPSAPAPEPTIVSADDVVPDPAVTQVENSEASEEDTSVTDEPPKQQPVA
jgi:CheY-like chemotaxis protein